MVTRIKRKTVNKYPSNMRTIKRRKTNMYHTQKKHINTMNLHKHKKTIRKMHGGEEKTYKIVYSKAGSNKVGDEIIIEDNIVKYNLQNRTSVLKKFDFDYYTKPENIPNGIGVFIARDGGEPDGELLFFLVDGVNKYINFGELNPNYEPVKQIFPINGNELHIGSDIKSKVTISINDIISDTDDLEEHVIKPNNIPFVTSEQLMMVKNPNIDPFFSNLKSKTLMEIKTNEKLHIFYVTPEVIYYKPEKKSTPIPLANIRPTRDSVEEIINKNPNYFIVRYGTNGSLVLSYLPNNPSAKVNHLDLTSEIAIGYRYGEQMAIISINLSESSLVKTKKNMHLSSSLATEPYIKNY